MNGYHGNSISITSSIGTGQRISSSTSSCHSNSLTSASPSSGDPSPKKKRARWASHASVQLDQPQDLCDHFGSSDDDVAVRALRSKTRTPPTQLSKNTSITHTHTSPTGTSTQISSYLTKNTPTTHTHTTLTLTPPSQLSPPAKTLPNTLAYTTPTRTDSDTRIQQHTLIANHITSSRTHHTSTCIHTEKNQRSSAAGALEAPASGRHASPINVESDDSSSSSSVIFEFHLP